MACLPNRKKVYLDPGIRKTSLQVSGSRPSRDQPRSPTSGFGGLTHRRPPHTLTRSYPP
ncbi:hypothetical protein DPMN_087208 [Dreissena polymorpha]|uniref:Uncharacterized protein n=1 Tax=Dreissena polymorpha TaxID=45954 RepID=A0A9D4KRZ5_DREPO|nr:hypothetical protein DPMN_087208 [Dreissena polymorpha]